MSNNTNILGRPVKLGCIANAVGNPIIYILQRQDTASSQINDVGGFAQIQFTGVNITYFFSEGDTVAMTHLSGYDEVTGLITASEYTGGDTLITTNIPYNGTGVSIVNNASIRTDYRIEVEVFDLETNESLGARVSASPDVFGYVKINISGIVSAHLSANWAMPVGASELDYEASKNIYVKYQEYYEGVYHDLISDDANPVIVVFAMINLLLGSPPDFSRYQYGGNMFPYKIGTQQKKWLTRFTSPSMWRGWPFTISFLNQGFANPDRVVIFYNSAGEVIISDTTALALDGDGVYRLMLGAIEPQAVEVKLSIKAPDTTQLTEEIIIKIKDPCQAQVLLFWKNSLGGDSFWMFDESQEYRYTYPSGRKVTRMKLYSDNLTINEWDAINELNSPTDVMAANLTDYGMDNSIDKTHFRNDNQVYIINSDGEKVGVIVIESENLTKTMYKKHAVEINIELPEIFTV